MRPTLCLRDGRVLDSQTPNPPHGHSPAFLDPMAMSEDEDSEELVISQLIPSSPGSPQRHASFEPEAQPSPLTHFKPLSKVQSRTSTPEIIPADGVDNRKPNATHITTVVLSDLTTQDIEIHLDGVPVPFDFSLEETSLWYHPIFEARAIADIRRSLRALLPSDPSQDPSPADMDDWRAEVRPRRSGVQIWERPEDAFGSGSLDRGLGLWPKSKRPAAATEQDDADLDPQNGADTEVITANSHRSTPPPIPELPSRNRSPSPEVVADEALHPPDADGVVLVEVANEDISESEATALTAAPTPLVKGKTTLDETRMVRSIDAPGEVNRASERDSVDREVLNTSARACRVTNKRSRPDDAELMSTKDIPDWKSCKWCVRLKKKCAPRVGSQPPYRCFRCEDSERKCIPYRKKDPRRSGEYQLHPRLKIANNATGASLRRHPRLAGPSHPEDVAIPAPPSEDDSLGVVRRAKRHNELLRARHQVRKAELEANTAECHLKVALERFCLADEQRLAALAHKRFISKYK